MATGLRRQNRRATHQSREWQSRRALFWFVPIRTGRTLGSSCRACEAAFGCEAVVKPELAMCQADHISRTHDCFAAERSLASSTAATASAGSTAATDRIAAYTTRENPASLVHEFLN